MTPWTPTACNTIAFWAVFLLRVQVASLESIGSSWGRDIRLMKRTENAHAKGPSAPHRLIPTLLPGKLAEPRDSQLRHYVWMRHYVWTRTT